MQSFSHWQTHLPRMTMILGVAAWMINVACSLLQLRSSPSVALVCTLLSFVYMVFSFGCSVYCVKKSDRTNMVLSFLYWAAVLLLTLPVVLELFGALPATQGQNIVYSLLIACVNAPLFGLSSVIPFLALPTLAVLFATIQLSMLTWGVCKLNP